MYEQFFFLGQYKMQPSNYPGETPGKTPLIKLVLMIDPNSDKQIKAFDRLQPLGFKIKCTKDVGNALNIINSEADISKEDRLRIIVVCTNKNCEEVGLKFGAGSQFQRNISAIFIYCAKLQYGQANVERLKGKFKKAFVHPEDLTKFILSFPFEQLKVFEPTDLTESSNQYAKNQDFEKPVDGNVPEPQANGLSPAIYDFIGSLYINIGGKQNQKIGKQYKKVFEQKINKN